MLLSGPYGRILPALLVSTALAACNSTAKSIGDKPGQGQTVTVEVVPTNAELKPGEQLQFRAVVTGTVDTTVDWEVLSAGGGTIDATGLYTAPLTAGAYEVQGATKGNPNGKGKGHIIITPTPAVVVSVTPHNAAVAAGAVVALAATVTGSPNTAVTWAVREASGCGSVTPAGVYAAPAAAATCHVVATSSADPTKSDTATVTVSAPPPPPIAVTITPSTGAVNACQTVTFTATVTGTPNTTVSWSVQEGAAGGTITSGGVYTAPSSAGTYHVVATSVAAPTSSATVPVGVTERVLSVAVSPQQVSIPTGGTTQLTATVTTTCGAFTTAQAVSPN